ncbi:hypothetical protein AUK11_01095 [bacterium CG2_30_37_16]|nr:MAG: hypothetical protein AUK11_01095 [bacterium CG2_30_37_16]PIP30462.1 MAG: hypothetical protein COX25_04590 [bacterium (Candidatus Howlettbacteria) CG23_combo_of_CG06-09_8_20_14_all_37_9]PIX98710.1 MAG: hypothetical protein COZ22_04370 [bacterium (Candidatus Howlettbacteria) CG_4_10_14_3_um_filter_37_10]PJB06701.1 MAG: hypothetical protein CO123_01550 [bacterium (Candidatus Howlettbacteria) CG_4_9_14_3_um_filter_37_10]
MRDDKWLEKELGQIWSRYFVDVTKINKVVIKFGRRARTRLGSIKKLDNGSSLILINGLLKELNIPDFIVQATIAHELTHYAHGFSSSHERKFKHPHKGGVVSKEMQIRGLEDILYLQKKWLKENWINYINKHYPAKPSPGRRKRKKRFIFVFK